MPMFKVKRYSTTKRITRSDLYLLCTAFARGEGVIVRCKGTEYGAVRIAPGRTLADCVVYTWEGKLLRLSDCTIRKTTINTLRWVNRLPSLANVVPSAA